MVARRGACGGGWRQRRPEPARQAYSKSAHPAALNDYARDKPYACDLGWRAETLWRTPVSGPAARIDPEPAELCEAGRERLLEPDEEIPRQELAAVRMTGQLQVEAGAVCRSGRARLMREQHFGTCVARRAGECCVRVAAMRCVVVMGAEIGDAREHERCALVVEDDVLVDENVEPKPAQLADPCAARPSSTRGCP